MPLIEAFRKLIVVAALDANLVKLICNLCERLLALGRHFRDLAHSYLSDR